MIAARRRYGGGTAASRFDKLKAPSLPRGAGPTEGSDELLRAMLHVRRRVIHSGIAVAACAAQRAAMLTTIVMTVIGADRPGLVQQVAASVADHGGNWLESRMCRLGGQFAGILRVEVPAERASELTDALAELEAHGLRVIVHADGGAAAPAQGVMATLEVVGQDRPGILRSVSGVLAGHGVNVEELASERVSAPMGGGTLFQARASVLVPTGVNLAAVRGDLEKIAADLMVDLTLQAKV